MSNTINNANEVQVINNNGELVVSSRKVAEDFGKQHKHVLDIVREILVAEKSATKFFYENTYENRGKEYPEYLMNRDGFCLLVMSFNNTRDVLEWKIKYIEAFNAMEKKLKELSAPQTLDDTLNADVLFLIASKWKADSDKCKELTAKVAALEAQIKTQQQEVQPVISEATKVAIKEAKVEQHRLYTVTEIARECGFPDARTLNLALNDLGIQYKIKSHWKIAEKYEELGYAITVSPYANTPFLKWTLKGKDFIRQQLKEAHLL